MQKKNPKKENPRTTAACLARTVPIGRQIFMASVSCDSSGSYLLAVLDHEKKGKGCALAVRINSIQGFELSEQTWRGSTCGQRNSTKSRNMTVGIADRTSRLSTLYRTFTLPIICKLFSLTFEQSGHQTSRNQLASEEAVLV